MEHCLETFYDVLGTLPPLIGVGVESHPTLRASARRKFWGFHWSLEARRSGRHRIGTKPRLCEGQQPLEFSEQRPLTSNKLFRIVKRRDAHVGHFF